MPNSGAEELSAADAGLAAVKAEPIDRDSISLRALHDALGTYRRHQPDAVPSHGEGTAAKR